MFSLQNLISDLLDLTINILKATIIWESLLLLPLQSCIPERGCVHSPIMSHSEGWWEGCQAKKQAYIEEFLQQCGRNTVLDIQKQKAWFLSVLH